MPYDTIILDMIKIDDSRVVKEYIDKYNIQSNFSLDDYKFSVYKYKKGEYISSPLQQLTTVLFVVEGTVRIFGLRKNGEVVPINCQKAPLILGDLEFTKTDMSPFFSEAKTDITCIGISITDYKEQLNNDVKFLRLLLSSYALKIELFAHIDTQAQTIEERVLIYLRDYVSNHEINGIDAATLQLRCSRRQLQRVLSSLCKQGKIEKVKKGNYRLI